MPKIIKKLSNVVKVRAKILSVLFSGHGVVPYNHRLISSVFHLHNTSATRELSVYLDGQRLQHGCHPTYLGVTLDRTLSLVRIGCDLLELLPKRLIFRTTNFITG